MTASYVYQSQTQIAAELNAQGAITKRFIYGSKPNVPDYMVMNGKEYRIVSDQAGTPQMVVEAVTGKILEAYEYDEFGRLLDGPKHPMLPFGFAGGLADRDTNLVRFGARDYDPETGRWTSKDPIGFAGGDTNLFGYTFNDPVNFVDPSGLWGFGITGGGAVETGRGSGGTAGQVGSGIGYFGGGANSGWGGYTYSGWFKSDPSSPDQYVYGASGGVGGGLFWTNATNVDQLIGPFDTTTYNLFFFTYQTATDGKTTMRSLTFGKGWGLSVSRYSVNTETTWGSACP